MPWEKQFNVDDALKKAMQAFWSKGYEATSMQDLVDTMGVNRGSIYDTFGDKRALYIEALKRYSNSEVTATLSKVRAGRNPREAIQALFDGLIADAVVKKIGMAASWLTQPWSSHLMTQILKNLLQRVSRRFRRIFVS